ncbi:hypothetical protein Tco_1264031 [Tanacetum coccineum]
MEVLQHEHPLTLIDLNPEYPRDEVVYDDEEELIMKQDFRCPCGRCGQEINFYHRKDNFFHSHPLTLTYSFPKDDQKAKFDPRCKVLAHRVENNYGTVSRCASTASARLDARSQGRRHEPAEAPLAEGDTTGSLKFRHPLTLVDTPSCNNDITTTPSSSRITTSSSHDSIKMVEVVCNACIRPITNLPFYKCTAFDDGCKFVLHAWCTRLPTEFETMDLSSFTFNYKLLPQVPKFMVSHKYDKHQLTLRYFPVENYSGDYFCEVCEEEFNPNGVAEFDNVKFGDTYKVNGHPHVVSFCRGVESDGKCAKCGKHLQDKLIFKCLQYCATTSKEASPNAIGLNQGTSAVSKNYSDSDYSDLLHLPFPNQTDALNHFHGESGSKAFETNLTHPFHRHPLTLVDTPYNTFLFKNNNIVHS